LTHHHLTSTDNNNDKYNATFIYNNNDLVSANLMSITTSAASAAGPAVKASKVPQQVRFFLSEFAEMLMSTDFSALLGVLVPHGQQLLEVFLLSHPPLYRASRIPNLPSIFCTSAKHQSHSSTRPQSLANDLTKAALQAAHT